MGAIEDVYADLDADVSEDDFRAAVAAKVEEMGGLADEETAAMLVAHELEESEVSGVADVEPGMEEAKFVAKVVSVGEVRTFERDDEDADEGQVLNAEVADETGSIRVAFWDDRAEAAAEDLEPGQVLRIAGRPRDGYEGVEVSVDRAEPEPDAEIDVDLGEPATVADLTIGQSDVDLRGAVLQTGTVRTFDRDDGSEGQVADLVLGDETGRVRVTLWDEQADRVTEIDAGETVEVTDGYVRERDGQLELHVGDRGRVETVDGDVSYEPDATPIDEVAIDQTVDVAGVIRSTDPKRTFDRDDGSEGQVRNVRVQDDTGDIRVALWGEKADLELGPGDEVLFADVEIQDGWQDDLEASADWRSTVVELADGTVDAMPSDDGTTDSGATSTGLDDFAGGSGDGDPGDGETGEESAAATTAGSTGEGDAVATGEEPASGGGAAEDGEVVEFTGVVVQAGDPVILDDGNETVSVETDADLTLGEEVTARGTLQDGRLDADDVV
ncbi:MAG: single-stranded DNA binding protein [Halobacteriaceae archaeon]